MKEMLKTIIFFTWLMGMIALLCWAGIKLNDMQTERTESIKKLEQKLDETAKRAQEVCEQAVALCHQVGAQGCGECPK